MRTEIMELDAIDRRLVNLLQAEFPLSEQPFADLATSLSLSEREVLQRVSLLRERNMVRILGPVFNSRALGYQSTLVAMRVPETKLEQAAAIINEHHGVGHNYQREHFYNLWFTLAIRGKDDLILTLESFRDQIHPEEMVELPVLRLFKIRLFFDLEGNGSHAHDDRVEPSHTPVKLTDIERRVINQVQQQLPILSRPFDGMAAEVGMETKDFLKVCRELKGRGIMRRFGASIEHTIAGFAANAMVCWAVPDDRVKQVGSRMASLKEVTHCYERRLSPKWPKYNIFTMIHGCDSASISETVSRMIYLTECRDYEILNTVREFKKQRVRYRV